MPDLQASRNRQQRQWTIFLLCMYAYKAKGRYKWSPFHGVLDNETTKINRQRLMHAAIGKNVPQFDCYPILSLLHF